MCLVDNHETHAKIRVNGIGEVETRTLLSSLGCGATHKSTTENGGKQMSARYCTWACVKTYWQVEDRSSV